MIFAAAVLLAVFFTSLYYVAQPLFTYNQEEEALKKIEEEISRETIFLTLNELEFDYRTNKLSKGDYEKLSGKYKKLAAGLLKKEEEILLFRANTRDQSGKEVSSELENEVEDEIVNFIADSKKMEK